MLIYTSITPEKTGEKHVPISNITNHNCLIPNQSSVADMIKYIRGNYTIVAGNYAFTVPEGRKSWLLSENFIGSNLIIVDFDDYNFEEFVNNWGNICYMTYTTWSHTAESNRFRAVFRLPMEITSWETYAKLYRNFVESLPCDQSSKSPLHIYAGNPHAEIKIFNNTLSNDIIHKHMYTTKEDRPKLTDEKPISVSRSYTQTALESELEALRSTGEGNRHNQLLISAMKLASLFKSDWSDLNDWDHIKGLLIDCAVHNGLYNEDKRNVHVTIDNAFNYAVERPAPASTTLNAVQTIELPSKAEYAQITKLLGQLHGVRCADPYDKFSEHLYTTTGAYELDNGDTVIPYTYEDTVVDAEVLTSNGNYSFVVGQYPILDLPNDSNVKIITTDSIDGAKVSLAGYSTMVVPKIDSIIPTNININGFKKVIVLLNKIVDFRYATVLGKSITENTGIQSQVEYVPMHLVRATNFNDFQMTMQSIAG